MGLRNKVLEGLECCARRKDTDVDYCDKCPYFSGCSTEFGAFAELASDALALLKAQEPIAPIQGADDQDEDIFCCGSCGAGVGETFLGPPGECEVRHNYCPNCGRAVKWND